MPSDLKQTKHSAHTASHTIDPHIVFFPIVTLTLILWVVYRSVFAFPVWFDEILGKALFFGIPVWLYIAVTQTSVITDAIAPKKLYVGILQGIAIGGIFGFATSLFTLAVNETGVQTALLFETREFWFEFMLALFTAFWETLFFFCFVMGIIQEKFKNWTLTKQVLLAAVIFLLFHIPNSFLRFDPAAAVMQMGLLFLFAIGQALLFSAKRNGYVLILSHAIWGMVLLTHAGML